MYEGILETANIVFEVMAEDFKELARKRGVKLDNETVVPLLKRMYDIKLLWELNSRGAAAELFPPSRLTEKKLFELLVQKPYKEMIDGEAMEELLDFVVGYDTMGFEGFNRLAIIFSSSKRDGGYRISTAEDTKVIFIYLEDHEKMVRAISQAQNIAQCFMITTGVMDFFVSYWSNSRDRLESHPAYAMLKMVWDHGGIPVKVCIGMEAVPYLSVAGSLSL